MQRFVLFCLLGALAFVGCQPAAEAPEEEAVAEEAPAVDRGTAEASISGAQVSIDYGRPELKGRDMLAMLEDGQVWRLGMNQATSLETSADIMFGESAVKAGKYSIWAKKVSADEWHLIFNSEAEIWGTGRNPDNDVAEIPLEASQLDESVERFTIEVSSTGDSGGEIVMKWATLQLKAPFSTAPAREGSGS